MSTAFTQSRREPAARALCVGCVSFLNAKPLIDGLEEAAPQARIQLAVPSRLLALLEGGKVDVALCPVIDYFRSQTPLVIVPAGGIGCDGTTLTVRLFSQVPLEQIQVVHADTDSHSSVALMRVILKRRYGVDLRVVDYDARDPADLAGGEWPQAMLLIGDKVVTGSPPAVRYPHQLDLGHGWKELTGLPFVFAVWMARAGAELGDLPEVLRRQREANCGRIDELVARHAAQHGWPDDLARSYLGQWLRYEIGPRQLEAIERFGQWCAEAGLLEPRPVRSWR